MSINNKKIVCVEFIIVLFNKQCFPTHRSIPVAQYLVYISHKYYSILLLSSNIMLSNVFHDSGLPSRKSFNANILAVLTWITTRKHDEFNWLRCDVCTGTVIIFYCQIFWCLLRYHKRLISLKNYIIICSRCSSIVHHCVRPICDISDSLAHY